MNNNELGEQAQAQATDSAFGNTEGLLTKAEVAKWFHVTERTIDAWMRSGVVPFYRIGRRTVRFRLADVQNHLDAFCRVARRTR